MTRLPKAFANTAAAPKPIAPPAPPPAGNNDAPVPAAGKAPSVPLVVLGVNTTLKMPERASKRNTNSKYTWDTVEVGTSIGVQGRDAAGLTSTVSGVNRRFRVEKKDEAGNIVYQTKEVKDADGNTKSVATDKPVIVTLKHFFVVDTDPATDPSGASARIWRDK